MDGFDGKVALVTGAGSGLGKATALQFSQAGAKVALLDIDEKSLDAVVDAIQKSGGEALPLTADVSQEPPVAKAIQQIEAQWGRLDFVFANAGINGVWAPLHEITLEDWNKTIGINLTGTYLTLKHAGKLLQRQGGAVVVTASVNGTRMFSNTGATAYASTKAAQVAMAKMIALEWAENRVRVNVICPGSISTEIEHSTQRKDLASVREPVEFPEGDIPLSDGKPGKASDVADLVLFLCSKHAAHITGTEMWIDGAQSLIRG